MRILVVEDDKELREMIVKRLKRVGYSVDNCVNGLDALDYINQTEYDGVIMDISLPGMTGIEVLDTLRKKENNTPIMLLTARGSISDKVTGLDAGADDYMVKPFSFDELFARVRVMTRKCGEKHMNSYSLADLQVNCSTRIVTRGEKRISLSSKEFAILEYLIRNKRIVLSRDKIEQHIWNYDYEGCSNIIDVYIRYLRKKIDDGFDQKLIHTIRGAGYVLKDEE